MRYTPAGHAVCNFSIATDRQYTGQDGQQVKETTWVRISVWGKQAEACNQYLKKGKMVLVEGRLQPDPKTGGPRVFQRQDGTSGAHFEVNASTVKFLSPREAGEAANPEAVVEAASEEIPF